MEHTIIRIINRLETNSVINLDKVIDDLKAVNNPDSKQLIEALIKLDKLSNSSIESLDNIHYIYGRFLYLYRENLYEHQSEFIHMTMNTICSHLDRDKSAIATLLFGASEYDLSSFLDLVVKIMVGPIYFYAVNIMYSFENINLYKINKKTLLYCLHVLRQYRRDNGENYLALKEDFDTIIIVLRNALVGKIYN